MKKMSALALTLLLLCAALSVCLPFSAKAAAFPMYVRVTEDGVKLYTNPEKSKFICVLEKTYYLKVSEKTNDNFYRVELMDNSPVFPLITGYVATDEVSAEESEPVTPIYPETELTVNTDSAKIYFLPLISSEVLVTATNMQSMSYYGEGDADGNWYYVYFNGRFGYVSKDAVTAPVIAAHPTPLPQPDPPPDDPVDNKPVDPEEPAAGTSEILLIVFVCLLSVGLVLALFLPGKNKLKKEYFDSDI